MDARTAPFHQLLTLIPELEALEPLRLALARRAFPRHDHVWSDGNDVATVDVRVLDRETVQAAIAEASQEQRRDTDDVYRAIGDALAAETEGDRAAAAFRLIEGGQHREAGGRFGAALRFYRTALEAASPLSDRAAQILALRRIARVQLARGDLAEAEARYQQSLTLAEVTERPKDEVIARTGLGNVYSRMGRWKEADACYREALARAEVEGDPGLLYLERAQLMNNLAWMAARLNRQDEAEEWVARAEAMWRVLDAPADRAVWHGVRAHLWWEEGRTGEAQEEYGRALAQNPPAIQRAAYQIDLAELLLETGNPTEARRWGREAEASAFEASAVGYISEVYRGLGNIARETGEEAVPFYEKAVEVARRHGLRQAEGKALVEYARLRARDDNGDEAAAYLQHAEALFQEIGAEADAEEARVELERLLGNVRPAPETPLSA